MNARVWARICCLGVGLFVVLLAALHFLEPEYDPSRNLISEYELGRFGWMMSLAFFSLGVSVLAMLRSTWSSPASRRGSIGRWFFIVIGVAFFTAGVFYPYNPPTLASYIHGISGMIIIAGFPIAATLYRPDLAWHLESAASRRALSWATALVWIGLLSFFGSMVVLGSLAGPVSRTEATLLIGWQNRFMILTYGFWLVVAAWPAAFSQKEPAESEAETPA
jgi:hypothetical membrane protein